MLICIINILFILIYYFVNNAFLPDTYEMTEVDPVDEAKFRFTVPYHYSSQIISNTTTTTPDRARRLAQEIASLSTSLPLSSSSSVFLCCDEERLDVMKVCTCFSHVITSSSLSSSISSLSFSSLSSSSSFSSSSLSSSSLSSSSLSSPPLFPQVLITGPSDTPYANGCFLFDVYFPPDYPSVPMNINLCTTGQGSVRFNPNLYNDGKVRYTILHRKSNLSL